MSDFGKVAVLLGGRSAEREISLRSGNAVLSALRSRNVNAHPFDLRDQGVDALMAQKFDRVFIALHGRYGEDGTIQGALELAGIPYTGSGVMASALAMDKWRTKLIWQAVGVSTPAYRVLEADTDFAAVVAELGLPIMVKPASEGSSIGMSKVLTADALQPAYEEAAKHDKLVIAEQFIDGLELTAGILGDHALPLIALQTPRIFYDYQAKYHSTDTKYICPCGLPEKQEHELQALALKAFQVVGCRGWGRVDLMLDKDGHPYFLEVNTSPGMTDHSLVPMAAKQAGLSFEDLVMQILELAYVA